MKIAIPQEGQAGERRVAATPETCGKLKQAGFEVLVEREAGTRSGFSDGLYEEAGAALIADRAELYGQADVVAKVRCPAGEELDLLKADTILIALLNPLSKHDDVRRLAERRISALAMELMPRIRPGRRRWMP